ncbi:MAG: pyridoxamine 5'-phosphate oxidase [Dehalococcoidia bacterium]|nr:MAG: pyridoxamine 5'-phosphate oxidase [Dehalococcoidia bacterium]
MSEPTASHPDMPGYLGDPAEARLLPWAWAEARLRDAHNYWLSTHTNEGGPHLAPVWAVWDGTRIFLATGTRSKKARNLYADSRCSLATESGEEAVIVEGTAQPISDADAEVYLVLYEAKYGARPPAGDGWVVTPQAAFGFIEEGDEFAKTATRWRW